MTNPNEIEYMKLAISEARKSRLATDGRIHPYVGAVAVRDGEVLGEAHHGQQDRRHHAEYALLKKLEKKGLAGCTVYTTLEPCTVRCHPKVPCADRLIERRVSRVVIGMLDPDQRITGKGVIRLRKARIEVDLFPAKLAEQLEDLNREFIKDREARATDNLVPHSQIRVASSSARPMVARGRVRFSGSFFRWYLGA